MLRWRGGLLFVSLLANAVMGWQLQQQPAAVQSPALAEGPRRVRLPLPLQPLRLPDQASSAAGGPQVAALAPQERPRDERSDSRSEPSADARSAAPADAASPRAGAQNSNQNGRSERESGRRRSREPLERFDESRLRALGMDDREISRYRAHIEAMRAEGKRAQEDALRAGESRTAVARQQKVATQRAWTELRQDFGAEVYDTLLYATHQGNRAQVIDIVQGSPAASAGFRKGDLIVFYDRERVFGPGDISALSRSKPGRQTVLVEVQRGPQLLELYVPRGKMGVRLESRSIAPTRF